MPKSLKEIKGFTQGTIHNISERDISDDTAAFSLNIDPIYILQGLKEEKKN